jgi:hypothetical protein
MISSLSFQSCKTLVSADLLHLDQLTTLTTLEFFWLPDGCVTDATLETISRLPNLRALAVFGARGCTNAGMTHVAKLTSLWSLKLSADDPSRLNNEGLRLLKPLTQLTSLLFSATEGWYECVFNNETFHIIGSQFLLLDFLNINDIGSTNNARFAQWNAGFDHLTVLPLTSMMMIETMVSDRGLAAIGHITSLESLSLEHSHFISSAGLAQLRGLVKLYDIDLGNWLNDDPAFDLTDASLEPFVYLAQYHNLASISLCGDSIAFDINDNMQHLGPNARRLINLCDVKFEVPGVHMDSRGNLTSSGHAYEQTWKVRDVFALLKHVRECSGLAPMSYCMSYRRHRGIYTLSFDYRGNPAMGIGMVRDVVDRYVANQPPSPTTDKGWFGHLPWYGVDYADNGAENDHEA